MDLPDAKYDHVFAILRVDKFLNDAIDEKSFYRSLITIKKVVWSQEAAEQEVDRLNKL